MTFMPSETITLTFRKNNEKSKVYLFASVNYCKAKLNSIVILV